MNQNRPRGITFVAVSSQEGFIIFGNVQEVIIGIVDKVLFVCNLSNTPNQFKTRSKTTIPITINTMCLFLFLLAIFT